MLFAGEATCNYFQVDSLPELSTNCPFMENSNLDGYIDNEEREIMQHCFDNRIENVEDFSNNVLGTWELVGHGEGWVASISQPCSTIEITEQNMIVEYKDQYTDTTTTHSWGIVDATNYTYIETYPASYYAINRGIFCGDYLYADATPSDGNMYLYQRKQPASSTETSFSLSSKPFRVFPNPTTGLLNIEKVHSNQELSSIHVYDLLGREVSSDYSYKNEDILLDLKGNAKGTYFLVLDVLGKLYPHKIVIF